MLKSLCQYRTRRRVCVGAYAADAAKSNTFPHSLYQERVLVHLISAGTFGVVVGEAGEKGRAPPLSGSTIRSLSTTKVRSTILQIRHSSVPRSL
eukprot:1938065-Rhodomonas_salina.1